MTIEAEGSSGREESGQRSCTVSGRSRQDAFAAGLDAVLEHVISRMAHLDDAAETRASAIRGEGPDLAALFADLVSDLLEQLEDAGGAFAVRLDGLLRKDEGGFVAWGYVDLSATSRPAVALPRLAGRPEVGEAEGQLISIRFTFTE